MQPFSPYHFSLAFIPPLMLPLGDLVWSLRYYMNRLHLFNHDLSAKIHSIPRENKHKFMSDYLKLIELAHKENYNEIKIPES